jgi:hypothetical protein
MSDGQGGGTAAHCLSSLPNNNQSADIANIPHMAETWANVGEDWALDQSVRGLFFKPKRLPSSTPDIFLSSTSAIIRSIRSAIEAPPKKYCAIFAISLDFANIAQYNNRTITEPHQQNRTVHPRRKGATAMTDEIKDRLRDLDNRVGILEERLASRRWFVLWFFLGSLTGNAICAFFFN